MLVFEIPFPPSVNHYWGVHGKRRYIKKRGLQFREDILNICGGLPKLIGDMGLLMEVYPPDNRRRDLDNLLKATLDAMEKAELYKDDKDFIDIRIVKKKKVESGKVIIKIWEIE